MPNKMLIDASHPEETRVVVVRGNRIEEFDFESQDKKQLKGNIYLARVTRVEPSLQAAFVEYGGNRHGFLAFSEIHPDYYQIPVADRQALLHAEAQEAQEEDDEENEDHRQERGRGRRNRRRGGKGRERGENKRDAASSDEPGEDNGTNEDVEGDKPDLAADKSDDSVEATDDAAMAPVSEEGQSTDENASPDADEPKSIAASVDADVISEPVPPSESVSEDDEHGLTNEVHVSQSDDRDPAPRKPNDADTDDHDADDHDVESVGAEDALDEVRNRRKPVRRQYKIQEVIKRRQILLVQVVKEERGNKGAAITTYLSLAGRYSVLMPNTARGGGISRKITNAQDRKRLKEVVADLEVPQGMGVILRTAGESRTKAEIKRDYEYLMRLWENVRNLTLQSSAPALVYEEGSLIKRSVRDLYNKDIDEVLVSGDEGYREAKDFMRMLMPSHAKVVQPYRDITPIFVRSGIEAQLDRMVQPQVTLKSGGYIIINQTEALVAIDVNSGRSTKEHSIEETALHTNLEAAEEVARQLRLRDLAGLIVIDFIDMEENRNNRAVEKRLKDHLKNDRARIQVGRISHFGLMEMSRQRIRASVLESTMKPCPQCSGTGHVRSDSSVALMVVRAIEEFLLKDSRNHITVRTLGATALYVLNHKRSTLVELENRFGVTITVESDETVGLQHYAISRGVIAEKPEGFVEARPAPAYVEPDEPDEEIVVEEEDASEAGQAQSGHQHSEDGGEGQRERKRRRRRRRRGGKDRENSATEQADGIVASNAPIDSGEATGQSAAHPDGDVIPASDETSDDGQGKKRRRGKRGGKRNKRDDGAQVEASDVAQVDPEMSVASDSESEASVKSQAEPVAQDSVTETVTNDAKPTAEPANDDNPVAEKPKKPRRAAKPKKAAVKASEAVEDAPANSAPIEIAVEAEAPAKKAAEKKPATPRTPRRKAAATKVLAEPVVSSTIAAEATEPTPEVEDKPKRAGWWQRKGFF